MASLIDKFHPRRIRNLYINIKTFIYKRLYQRKFNPFILRPGTTDINVFRSIFVEGEFKLPVKIDPKLIIDAGAYSGLSALYYSHTYPHAKIMAVEPEQSNFETLTKHTENNPNIVRFQAGLWPKKTHLKIRDRQTGKWGFAVSEVSGDEDYDVKTVTIPELLSQSGHEVIDILKIDIEGSEKELFSTNYQDWLDKVNIIVIELHDRIKPGCTDALYNAVNLENWQEFKEGEKVILARKKFL